MNQSFSSSSQNSFQISSLIPQNQSSILNSIPSQQSFLQNILSPQDITNNIINTLISSLLQQQFYSILQIRQNRPSTNESNFIHFNHLNFQSEKTLILYKNISYLLKTLIIPINLPQNIQIKYTPQNILLKTSDNKQYTLIYEHLNQNKKSNQQSLPQETNNQIFDSLFKFYFTDVPLSWKKKSILRPTSIQFNINVSFYFNSIQILEKQISISSNNFYLEVKKPTTQE